MKKYIFLFLTQLIPLVGIAAELYSDFPEEINPEERYVFYLHGLIVEGNDPRPKHQDFGIYEFPEIKNAIFNEGDFNLIAHHRPANTNINSYVEALEGWVSTLLSAGVNPSRITLVGFSRGSHLAAFVAGKLNETGINTALLASCINGDVPTETPLYLGGHFLSIYEESDVMGSCTTLGGRSRNIASFKEISISTGLAHGAFFQPLQEWLVPLKKWIRETNR